MKTEVFKGLPGQQTETTLVLCTFHHPHWNKKHYKETKKKTEVKNRNKSSTDKQINGLDVLKIWRRSYTTWTIIFKIKFFKKFLADFHDYPSWNTANTISILVFVTLATKQALLQVLKLFPLQTLLGKEKNFWWIESMFCRIFF